MRPCGAPRGSAGLANVRIEVLNAIGHSLFYSEEKISSSSYSKEIDLSSVAGGIYLLVILAESCGKANNVNLKKKLTILH